MPFIGVLVLFIEVSVLFIEESVELRLVDHVSSGYVLYDIKLTSSTSKERPCLCYS